MKKSICILICLLCTISIFSNGAAFIPYKGKAGVLIPIKNDTISMINETIIIDVNYMNNDDIIKYNCHFTFKNNTKEEQDIIIGFPIDYYWTTSETRDWTNDGFTSSDGDVHMDPIPVNILAEDLKVWINEIQTDYRKREFAPNEELEIMDYDMVFAFDAHFNPEETINVRIVYTEEKTSYGKELVDESIYYDSTLKYILKSARTWKNSIECSKIRINFLKKGYIPEIITMPEPYCKNFEVTENSLLFTFTDFYPPEDMEIDFKINKESEIPQKYFGNVTSDSRDTESLNYLNFCLIMEYLLKYKPDSPLIEKYIAYHDNYSYVRAKSISASSHIDWQDQYIPETIFDGKEMTGWLESVDGPGIGQIIRIILEKEIPIDEIKIMPGYFDPEWWAANNRVKKCTIDFGKKNYTISFIDERQIQRVKLPQPITTNKITFTIRDVYLSGKDNDTGISEIEFWYNGEKYIIGLPKR